MSTTIRLAKICEYCDQAFIAKTTVTKFCSHKCASAAYKQKKREEKLKSTIKNEFSRASKVDMNKISKKEFLSIMETCALIGISRMSLHRYIKKGFITPTKIGGRIIITRKHINDIFNLS